MFSSLDKVGRMPVCLSSSSFLRQNFLLDKGFVSHFCDGLFLIKRSLRMVFRDVNEESIVIRAYIYRFLLLV